MAKLFYYLSDNWQTPIFLPPFKSNVTTSMWCVQAAKCNGLFPKASFIFGLAPYFNNNLNIKYSVWIFNKQYLIFSTDTNKRQKIYPTASAYPLLAAKCKGVRFLLSQQFGLTPFLSNCSSSSVLFMFAARHSLWLSTTIAKPKM